MVTKQIGRRGTTRQLVPLAALLASLTGAAAQLSLSPNIVDTTCYPGASKSLSLSVANMGKEHLAVTATVYALSIAGGGRPMAVDDAPRSCKTWLKLSPEAFELDPGQGRQVRCAMQTPPDAAGGYYAMVSFLGVPPVNAPTAAGGGVRAGINLSFQVLAAMLVTVPAPQLRAQLESGEPRFEPGEGGHGYTMSVPLRNTGNIHARVDANVRVLSEAGVPIESFDLVAGGGFLLPSQERLFKAGSALNLPDGSYIVDLTLQVKQTPRPLRNRVPFVVQKGVPSVVAMTEELRQKLRQESAGFLVAPAQLQVALRPGGQRTQSVELRNLTNQPLQLTARVLDWQRSTTGYDGVLDTGRDAGPSARDEVTLRATNIELPPQSRQNVPLTISVPHDAVGCSYAAVTFDRADAKLDDSPGALARRSMLLEVVVDGTGQRAAKITDFRAGRLDNGAVAFGVKVTNTGNLTEAPDAQFVLLAKDGSEVARLRVLHDSQTLLQAGGTLILEGHLDRVVDPGSYTAQVFVQFAATEAPLTERMAFNLAPVGVNAPPTIAPAAAAAAAAPAAAGGTTPAGGK